MSNGLDKLRVDWLEGRCRKVGQNGIWILLASKAPTVKNGQLFVIPISVFASTFNPATFTTLFSLS